MFPILFRILHLCSLVRVACNFSSSHYPSLSFASGELVSRARRPSSLSPRSLCARHCFSTGAARGGLRGALRTWRSPGGELCSYRFPFCLCRRGGTFTFLEMPPFRVKCHVNRHGFPRQPLSTLLQLPEQRAHRGAENRSVPDAEASRLQGSGLRSRVRVPAPPTPDPREEHVSLPVPAPPTLVHLPRPQSAPSELRLRHRSLSHRPGPSASLLQGHGVTSGPGESGHAPTWRSLPAPARSHWPARAPAPAVRTWLAPGRPFGLGLRCFRLLLILIRGDFSIDF